MSEIALKKVKYCRSVYTRGINFQGQLGLPNGYKYVHDYTVNPKLQRLNIKQLVSDHSQNICVFNDYSILFWGWPLCTRTTYSTLESYDRAGRIVRLLQRFTPFFRNGTKYPQLEFSFQRPIVHLSLGCGYVSLLDDQGKAYAFGDNYAGQLGTGDDIHRDQPVLFKSITDQTMVRLSTGFQHTLFLNNEG